jgi:bifunctional ADP-heptose synthase (sugar kinase/adenylyltransferase)
MTNSLSGIRDSACRISDLNHTGNLLTASGRDEIDRQLVRIMMDSQAIQRTLFGSDAAKTYKDKVMSQLSQLVEKQAEYGDDPNREQLINVASAAELLAQSVRSYLAVADLIECAQGQQVEA